MSEPCPSPCDEDCDARCHEAHQPFWKREHTPYDCPSFEPCPGPCDHCAPEDWHACVLPKGHAGYGSCERDDG